MLLVTMTTSDPAPEPEPEAFPEPNAEPEAFAEAEPEAEPNAEPEPEAEAEPQPEPARAGTNKLKCQKNLPTGSHLTQISAGVPNLDETLNLNNFGQNGQN